MSFRIYVKLVVFEEEHGSKYNFNVHFIQINIWQFITFSIIR